MWVVLAASLGILSSQKLISLVLLLIAITMATIQGVLTPLALAYLTVIFYIIFLHQRYNAKKMLSSITEVILVITAILLFFHQLPGFHNPKILDKVVAGHNSTNFSMYFNFDKSLLTFVLFGALPTLFYTKSLSNHYWWHWCALIFSVPILLFIAVAIGVLKIELHFPDWIWQFALANLFFVSLAEEALFRGYMQQRLSRWFGKIPALFVVSILFGLIHFAGGYSLVIFATLAGLIYGIAWMWSGRLWVCTFFHFGLNLFHILFLTYPMYQA